MRSSLIQSVNIQRDGNPSGAFFVQGYNLGAETAATPAPVNVATAAGVERRAVRGFNVVVDAFTRDNYNTVRGWLVAGDLLEIKYTFSDGSYVTVKRIGATVRETDSAQLGTFSGWRLEGAGFAQNASQMLAVYPVLPPADAAPGVTPGDEDFS